MKHIYEDGFEFFAGTWPLDEKKPTLLFIHGAASSGRFWTYQIAGLAESANCIAVNLPGRGRLSEPACRSIAGYGDYLLGFMKHHLIRKPVVCGLSMGGAIVQELLIRHSESFSAGIAINTGARLTVDGMIFDAITQDFNRFRQMLVKLSLSPHSDLRKLRKPLQLAAIESPETAYKDFTACHHFDRRGDLSMISVPVLVLSAADDMRAPVSYGEFLSENIRDASHLCIENAGHLSPIEKPDEVNQAIAGFLTHIMGSA